MERSLRKIRFPHSRFENSGGRLDTRYTALIQQNEEWWIGWVEEIPGVNSQGATRDELMENLLSALEEALEMNRADALAGITGEYEEVSLAG